MIKLDHYIDAVKAETGIDLLPSNADAVRQREVVSAPIDQSLFIVAGPGSGKTTASTLRILKLIFVEGVATSEILATTFTRKAATALRSKIITFGEALRERFRNEADSKILPALDRLDLNAMRLGTLDSIAQDLLTEFRPAGAPAPRPIEEFARSSVFIVQGVLNTGLRYSRSLPLVRSYFYNDSRVNVGKRAEILMDLHNRLANDRIDTDAWLAAYPDDGNGLGHGFHRAVAGIDAVRAAYDREHVCDFAGLAELFLGALEAGSLEDYTSCLRFILVDEYQDTNLLQESIYFALAKAAVSHAQGGSICVVGDDDQSIYRFRGATVDLFQEFETRLATKVHVQAKRVELVNNYRSTPVIVDFVNEFVKIDPEYANGRVKPPKPEIVAMRKNATAFPVLGLFRATRADLSRDLAGFIDAVVNGPGVTISHDGREFTIQVDPANGSPHDVALLMGSVKETNTTGTQARLPLLLRRDLLALPTPIKMFNPRGEALSDQPAISALLGLTLLCIDPSGTITSTVPMAQQTAAVFNRWRQAGSTRFGSDVALRAFVQNWQNRHPTRQGRPARIAAERVSLNELFYKLISWLPEIQYDVEQLALLEAVTRAVVAASVFGPYDSEVVFGSIPLTDHAEKSVRSAIQTILLPIAEGSIEVNEDLLETLPRDRVSVLTVHQAKGLEFPITIVDVGSDAGNLNSFRAFKRYPDQPAAAERFEDELRPFCELGRPARSALNRAFDDLVRQCFVAYSRPQDVLILVGLNRCIQPRSDVQNVATGWRRAAGGGGCAWPELSNIAHVRDDLL
jgi:DNA helicase-2/ATP-dependent DNA helicase PcrA